MGEGKCVSESKRVGSSSDENEETEEKIGKEEIVKERVQLSWLWVKGRRQIRRRRRRRRRKRRRRMMRRKRRRRKITTISKQYPTTI